MRKKLHSDCQRTRKFIFNYTRTLNPCELHSNLLDYLDYDDVPTDKITA